MKIKIYDQKPQPGNLYCLNFFQYVLVKNFIEKLKYMFVVRVYWITKENYLCNGDDVTRKNKEMWVQRNMWENQTYNLRSLKLNHEL